MRGKITKRSVDALNAPHGKEVTLWDSEVKGFGVRIRKGSAKTYLLHYRLGSGRGAPIRKYTIGRHGSPWTPETARDEAISILGLVKQGNDPAGDKSARREMPTVQSLGERFLTDHVEAKRKSRTASEYKRLIERFIAPQIGKKPVDAITRQDIAKLHHGLRNTPYQANRVLAVITKMLNLAESWGMRPDGSNPCRHIEKFKEQARERFLSIDELSSLGTVMANAERAWADAAKISQAQGKEATKLRQIRAVAGEDVVIISPTAIAAIRLLIFTGARLMEVLSLEWDWIDFERGVARLPDSKTGAKTIHMPPPALALLSKLKPIKGNPYCFPGGKEGSHLINLEKPWQEIREAAGLENVRLHDLRHTHASMGAASGLSLPMIGKMLGHSQSQTTARYAHLASDPVATAAALVAGKLSDAMAPAAAKEQTLDLKNAKRRRP